LQNSGQTNGDNLNNVKLETSGTFQEQKERTPEKNKQEGQKYQRLIQRHK
jgi:hypothetical protein